MRLEANVRGRVQGVGFRFFVQRKAKELGISGFVRNEPNGDVFVVAEGSEEQIDALLEALHEGPGRVDNVYPQKTDSKNEFRRFEVRH